MRRGFFQLRIIFTGLVIMILLIGRPTAGLGADLIAGVEISGIVNPANGDTARITWQIAEPALVTLIICDLDGNIVKTFYEQTAMPEGTITAEWDGCDDQGDFCPDGGYVPVIRAKTDFRYQTYNPTTKPWGGSVDVKDITYDSGGGRISYSLERPALCILKAGEKEGGPLYATLFAWQARQPGGHQEPWDGMDAQKVRYVADRPDFEIILDAMALPVNSIMIQDSPRQQLSQGKNRPQFHLHPPSGNDLFIHSLHERRFCREIRLEVAVSGKKRKARNIPEVKGPIFVHVDIPDKAHMKQLLRERVEVYAFLDGRFVTEEEAPVFPMTLEVPADQFAKGEHMLTINARTPQDHLGCHSMKVVTK